MRIHLVLLAAVLVTACSSSKPEAPPAQEKYRYEIAELWLKNEPKYSGTKRYITFEGKKIADPLSETLAFEVPASTMIGGKTGKIMMELPSTCGVTKVPLEVEIISGKSEEEERRETDREVAAKRGWVIRVRVTHNEAWPVQQSILYLDNTGNPEPVKVKVGTREYDVDAGVGAIKKEGQRTLRPGLGRADVPVGDCETARTVSVGDKTLGQMSTSTDEATLVDINGGHCYVRIGEMYVIKGRNADLSKAPAPSEPIVYAAEKGRFVHHVKPVFSFNGGLQDSMMTEDTAIFQERTELVPVSCKDVKRVVEAARRGM